MFAFLLSLLVEPEVITYIAPRAIVAPLGPIQHSMIESKQIVEEEPEPFIEDGIACYCVTYVRSLGVKIPIGTNAEDFTANTTPVIGGLALFKFSNNVYHVAKITIMQGTRFKVEQANKIKCTLNEEWHNWNDPAIRGFWSPQGVDTL